MSEIKIFAKYNKEHLWARKMPDGTYKIGITDHAQEQLGDVNYVDLPDEGDQVECGVSLGSIESSKAVSELIAPVSGIVSAVNEEVIDESGLTNSSPYDLGWLIEIEPSDWEKEYAALLDADGYRNYLDSLE